MHFSLYLKWYSICLLFLGSLTLHAQLHFDWAVSQGGKVSDFTGTLQSDYEGNLFSMSEFTDTTDLDPGPGTDWVWPTTSNPVVISKMNMQGSYQWSVRFYAGEEVYGSLNEIINDHIRLLLTFKDSLVYQFQGNTTTLFTRPGSNSVFLYLNLDGTIEKAHYFATSGDYYVTNLFTLPNGNTVLGGSFAGDLSLADGSPLIAHSLGGYDVFMALLDPDDQPVWMTSFGTPRDEDFESMAVQGDEIYFAVTHTDTLHVNTASGEKIFPSNGEDNNVFGYTNLDGVIQNVYAFGGDLGDQLRGIVVDENQNIYIGGYFSGTVNFAGEGQAPVWETTSDDGSGFVAKYDHDGRLIWDRVYHDTYYGGVYTLSLERGNELYIGGGFTNKIDLDPGPDSIIVEADTHSDIYISKLNLNGDLQWSYAFYGSDYEGIREINVSTTDARVTLLGYFYDSLNCEIAPTEYFIHTNGGSDVFLISFTEDNVISAVQDVWEADLTVYPNPTTDHISVHCEKTFNSLSLFNSSGIMVRHFPASESHTAEIHIGGLPPGLYYLQGITSENVVTTTVLKL